MKNMTLNAVALACKGQLHNWEGHTEKQASGVVIDSRKVKKDYIFIATLGERVDGHDFIDDVFNQGALAVICEKPPADLRKPYILVKNSFIALKDLAKWYRMQLDIKVIGITGSVGKTSSKEFISNVLSMKYKVLKTEGNYNNEIGMPLTILKIRDEHELAVLEMGISDFNEMHRLSEIAKPDIAVITNIGPCHLENLGTKEGVLKAKTEIFDFINENGQIILNGDDVMLMDFKNIKGIKPIKFGINKDNNIAAQKISVIDLFTSSIDIKINDICINNKYLDKKLMNIEISVAGKHMIYNALAAVAIGMILDVCDEDIATAIKNIKSIGGRSNIISLDKFTIIDDCYNANPVSMKAAIDLLDSLDTRKVAILGDMFELGEKEKDLHKEVGIYASNKVDKLICVGKLSAYMYEGALENPKASILYFETRQDLIKSLPRIIKEGDSILVKASNGMGFNQVVQNLSSLILE